MNEKPLHFPALTGIRAIAAYLVYLYHTNPFTSNQSGGFIHGFVDQFHIGVNIFFVLSGLLITLRYYETSPVKDPWLRKYFQNRIARVYPMYFILTTVTLVVLILQGQSGQRPLFTYFMNITFLKGFFDDLKFTLIAQGWSLTVEECFYVVAPLLFLGFRKSKWSIYFFTVAFLVVGWLLVSVFHASNFHGFFTSYSFLFTYTFPGRCMEFFWGAGLVVFFRSQLRKELKGITFTLLGAGLTACIVIIMTIIDINGNSEFAAASKVVLNNFLLPGAIAMFFYGLMREDTLVKKILGSTFFVTLGKASYTFYLIHVGIIYALLKTYFSLNFFFTFLFLNVIALGLWYTLEEPLNKLIRRL